ncbi:MAG: dephospho-CoA kinase [Firmicutes bacterium HGW-Firmicutes-14]|nr:MAG: dephospho-CoA kinase [Firmicutes bacterium HGW-Firmicutes-14]
MPVIGLTGSIASGKSLVAGILQELGARVIDADIVAREVVMPGTRAWEKIRDSFGDGVLNADNGTIDRKRLGRMVFSDPDKRKRLNEITHPLITDLIKKEIDTFRAGDGGEGRVLVIDAPLLIETGLDQLVDEVWVVDIPVELQVARLMERDRLTRREALARISAQMPLEEKKKYARRIIDNSQDTASTRQMVMNLWKDCFGKSGVEIVDE